ncbi:bifunctional nuclease family protein [Desulfovibrio aminophilus]|nr:bifunctional nuclease family protein [Desulfovibrio aminophilus]MCM0756213.1 bifunctional nuclease family protein [Desulfovibrio aminophilus]
MVRVEVFGLALDEKSQAPVLILKAVDGERILPIWIGAMEAMAISVALNKVAFPRPMTHDLLLNVLRGLGGQVSRVEVTTVEEGTFFAEIVISKGGETLRVDSRPSDAMALALRAEAPLFVSEQVLEQAGTMSPGAYEAVLKSEDADKWTEELEKLTENGNKYKM